MYVFARPVAPAVTNSELILTLMQKGNEVKLDIFAYTNTENMRPEPFEVRFSPRTPKIQDMILSEAMIASEDLSIYDWETKVTIKDALQDA